MMGVESVYWEKAMTRVESVYWNITNSHDVSRECLLGHNKQP